MSITNELRKWAIHNFYYKERLNEILAIADRIDMEHKHNMEERADRYSELRAKMNNCYIELHKDADNEYIHEHDNVDWRDHAGTWHENATVVALCNDGCYVIDGSVFHVHKSDIRHYHAPTVEDVLREFTRVGIRIAAKHGIKAGEIDFYADEEAIAEYAAKLRLAKEDA